MKGHHLSLSVRGACTSLCAPSLAACIEVASAEPAVDVDASIGLSQLLFRHAQKFMIIRSFGLWTIDGIRPIDAEQQKIVSSIVETRAEERRSGMTSLIR